MPNRSIATTFEGFVPVGPILIVVGLGAINAVSQAGEPGTGAAIVGRIGVMVSRLDGSRTA
jgi:hypothetical protein